MAQTTVGIRELKAQLAHYLRQVKNGATLVITERGRPVGRIVPASLPMEGRALALVEAGLINWSGRKLPATRHGPRVRGSLMVADLLIDNRK